MTRTGTIRIISFNSVRYMCLQIKSVLEIAWHHLTHCGLETTYGVTERDRASGNGLIPPGNKPFTWTNVDQSSTRSCAIHMRGISQDILKISFLDMSLKIANLRLQSPLPRANDLSDRVWQLMTRTRQFRFGTNFVKMKVFLHIKSHFQCGMNQTSGRKFHGTNTGEGQLYFALLEMILLAIVYRSSL